MVAVNATLFVQILHFCFVWFLLDRFLFRFLVKIVQGNQMERRRLRIFVEQEKQHLNRVQLHKEAQWKSYRKKFATLIPPMFRTLPLIYVAPPVPDVSFDENKKQVFVKKIKDTIIQRILGE